MFYSSSASIRKNSKGNIYRNPQKNVLKVNQVSIPSLYYFQVYKTSDFPNFTGISTDFFAIGGTDHDTGDGGIIWGECDDCLMTNFVEKGTILSEYQCETPQLIKIPTSESGLETDEYFLYYHTDIGDPSNSGKQQTHLLTTNGGSTIHGSTWTQQGTPLGTDGGSDNHTGYLNVIKRGVSDYIGFHLTMSSIANWKYSTSEDGLTWIRGSLIDNTANLPTGIHCSFGFVYPFSYGGNSYVATSYYNDNDATDEGVMICTHDSNYRPNSIVSKIVLRKEPWRHFSICIDGDIMGILWKGGTTNSDNLKPYRSIRYDLRDAL